MTFDEDEHEEDSVKRRRKIFRNIETRLARVRKEPERKSGWDQFCDFTSLVGFRLLHTKNPTWLRTISCAVMVLSCALIFFQTREAFTRLTHADNSRVASVRTDDSMEIAQPQLVICVTGQAFSLLKSYGSVDFRFLAYIYASGQLTGPVLRRLEHEIHLLDSFFNVSASQESVYETANELAGKLKLFRQIGDVLSVSDFHTKLQGNFFADYQAHRRRFDDCLISGKNLSDFVTCRLAKARIVFDEFKEQSSDYFKYIESVTMTPDETIIKSHFFDDDGTWSPQWKVDNGACVYGGPTNRKHYDFTDIQNDKFDNIFVKTNTFEARSDAKIMVYLIYQDHRTNLLELVAGQNLEVSVRGLTEISTADCTNVYPPACLTGKDPYTAKNCKWCVRAVRDACPCANPDLFLAGVSQPIERNCSLLELARCSTKQIHRYHSADCENPCSVVEYSIGYAALPLTLEMLNVTVAETERVYVAEQQRVMDKLQEFGTLQPLDVIAELGGGRVVGAQDFAGVDAPIWKARAELQDLLEDYFKFITICFKIVYGRSHVIHPVFAEDFLTTNLSERISELGTKSVAQLFTINDAQLDDCGERKVDVGNAKLNAFLDFSRFFFDSLKATSIHEHFGCAISVPPAACRRLLKKEWRPEDLQRLQAQLGIGDYLHLSLPLAVTLNATALNPLGIVQYYDDFNFRKLVENTSGLRQRGRTLLDMLAANGAASDCERDKADLLREFLNSTVIAEIVHQRASELPPSIWLTRFTEFCRRYRSMRLLDDYIRANTAQLTLTYQGLVEETIIYRFDYSFWEFLSDVGGILGLYFGLTVITVYEMLVFTAIDDEPPERRAVAPHKFSRRFIYRRDRNIEHDLVVPRAT